jgi:hydrogenase-4 component H
VCPEKAITMSRDFETATNDIGDLQQEIEIFMGTCQRCGRCFKEPGPLDGLMLKGYRQDDLESERWVYRSESFLDSEAAVRDIEIELD